jgi:hypothetical protein
MKTGIHKSGGSETPYMMIRVSPKEACDLIASLSRQVGLNDPNTGRLERLASGDFSGYISISVEHSPICLQCGVEVPHGTAKLEKAGFICKEHLTHAEVGEKTIKKFLKTTFGEPKAKKSKPKR